MTVPGPEPDRDPDRIRSPGRWRTSTSAAAAATPGAWLELSVAADHEAVEAVSEILARAAPGGTSVEPAFELVEEGLAAKVDLARPAMVRAHLPILDPAAVANAVARAERDLGHLQAFGLRPIGDLSARVVHEEDWANAWKAHFPVLRVGRRIVIRPTWRRHRREPGDVILALDPGMAFGTGLHPTTRLCLAALESLADRGVLAVGAARTAARRGSSTWAPGPGSCRSRRRSSGRARCSPWTWTRSRSTHRRRTRGATACARVIRSREGSAPSGEGPFDVVLANLIASLLITLADGLLEDVRPGGTLLASGIFENREADVTAAFEARGLVIARALDRGRLGGPGGPPPRLNGHLSDPALRSPEPARANPRRACRRTRTRCPTCPRSSR